MHYSTHACVTIINYYAEVEYREKSFESDYQIDTDDHLDTPEGKLYDILLTI